MIEVEYCRSGGKNWFVRLEEDGCVLWLMNSDRIDWPVMIGNRTVDWLGKEDAGIARNWEWA